MQVTTIVIRFATRGMSGGGKMEKTKIYSPEQAGIGTLLFGPLPAVYFLWANFKALGQAAEAKQTLIWGLLGSLLLLALVPFLPAKSPNLLIPLLYSLAVRFLVDTLQLKKEAIAGSEQYGFRSNWSVFWIGLGLLIVFLIIAVGLLLALDALGIAPLQS